MPEFDLDLYKTRSEVIRQTVEQVKKDFGMFGMEVQFTGHTDLAYNEMFSQLSEHIFRLMTADTSRLAALLYQVDLSEAKIAEAEILHPGWSRSEIITELVIHRELKKVLLRNYFKNNPDKL